jgi:hypothetical protein
MPVDDSEPRAKTAEEVRKEILDHFRVMVDYWAHLDGKTKAEALDGLMFSVLVTLDGGSGLPAFDLVCSPHPDDEEFLRSEGENWYPAGVVINECQLHDLWAERSRR